LQFGFGQTGLEIARDRNANKGTRLAEESVRRRSDRATAAVTQLLFNDKNPEFIEALKSEVAKVPGVETLRYRPAFRTESIGRDTSRVAGCSLMRVSVHSINVAD